jgi:putative tryptophan/tyrosine transport system substrate-binding protein
MRRREFIAGVGAAAMWPFTVRAQQPAMPRVGWLNSASPAAFAHFVAAFRQGLGDAGFVENQNVAIEYRWSNGQDNQLPALAADLINRGVTVIVAAGGPVPGRIAKASTSTIPIVFIGSGDPVGEGLVASLNRPGGNATGVNPLLTAVEGKRLGLLRELVPSAARTAVLLNPALPPFAAQLKDVEDAARAAGQKIQVLRATNPGEIDAAFAAAAQMGAQALLVGASAFFNNLRAQLVQLAARYSIPTIYHVREIAVAGGLMSYGVNLVDAYRLVGTYTGRILKGEKPADLPVQQPTKFELVINLKTAKTLGLSVPPSLLARADEVIE